MNGNSNNIKQGLTYTGITAASSLAIGTAFGISPLEALVIGTAGAGLLKTYEWLATDIFPPLKAEPFIRNVRHAMLGGAAAGLAAIDAVLISKTHTPASREVMLQLGAYSTASMIALMTQHVPEKMYEPALKKARYGLAAFGILLAGLYLPTCSAPSATCNAAQSEQTAEKQDTAPADNPHKRQLAQTQNYTLNAYSNGFRRGDLVVIEFDPQNNSDSISLSYAYKKSEQEAQTVQQIPVTAHNDKYYGLLAIDFRHPAQNVKITLGASLEGYTFREQYTLTLAGRVFETEQLPPKSTVTPSTPETSQEKKAKELFYSSWNPVSTELYVEQAYHAPVHHDCDTAKFGAVREWQGSQETGRHNGVDCSAPEGDPIFSVFDGKVAYASLIPLRDTGYTTLVDHGLGLYTWYGHQSKITAERGSEVEAGEKIGEIGSTGRSTGPHLHIGAKLYRLSIDPSSLEIMGTIFYDDN